MSATSEGKPQQRERKVRKRETSKDKCFPYKRASGALDQTSSSVNSLLRSCQQEVPLQLAALSIKVLTYCWGSTGAVLFATSPPSSYKKAGPLFLNHKIKVNISSHPSRHPPPFPFSSLQLGAASVLLHVFQRYLSQNFPFLCLPPPLPPSATLQTIVLFLGKHFFTKGILLLNFCLSTEATRGKTERVSSERKV